MIIDEIDKKREADRLTINKVAEMSGMDSSTLTRWIKGERNPFANIEKIAESLDCEWKLVPKKKGSFKTNNS